MEKSTPSLIFLDLDEEYRDLAASAVVVIPVPFERTTSYGKGTATGPSAILQASQQVELYDEELRSDIYKMGIATQPAWSDRQQSTTGYLEELAAQVKQHLEKGRFVVCLGGEHTLTQAPVSSALGIGGPLGVVQFDAHADLREVYEGTPFSHACVMRRIREMGIATLGVGIRSLSTAEAQLIQDQDISIVLGQELAKLTPEKFRLLLKPLPQRVYLTFDVDFLDPSLVPATGTPEPGGGQWWPTLELLRVLFEEKEVVAMDLVELAPLPGETVSDFIVAKLAYKCMGYYKEALDRRLGSAGQDTAAVDIEDLPGDVPGQR